MPANLPPPYYEKERELKFAQTPEEKIQIFMELLAIMPKHKGTDKLKGDLRAKISKFRKEIGKKSGVSRFDFYHVSKEGAAQVVMLGSPNTGKSQILKVLTNAEPEVRNYPFTTQKPQVGMILYENIQLQLVDMPPISKDYAPGWIFGIARGSDLLLLVLDLKKESVIESMQTFMALLESARIEPIANGTLTENQDLMLKKAIFVCNKGDSPGADARYAEILKQLKKKCPVLRISAATGNGVEKLKDEIFNRLEIIRVYTKPPHRDIDRSRPYVLKKGSKIIELAAQIHKDFRTSLKYVRLWRQGKYKGMRIDRDEILQDHDIVEFHTK
ncbi:MAG: TGS domain-containing protein [Candidatus Cloacimonadota bacterium]|nr:MAG: TGS domain-containing protein [Candidatus Cloacimonadota bacterium]